MDSVDAGVGHLDVHHLLFLDNDVSRKKKFLKSLDKIDGQELLDTATTISNITKDYLSSHSPAVNSIRGALDTVKLLSESSSRTLTIVEMSFSAVIEFYTKALNAFEENLRHRPSKARELNTVDSLHFTLQTLLVIIEKSCSFEKVDRKMIRKLYYSLRRLLKYEQIPLNTMNNCGLLIVSVDYYYLELISSIRLLERSIHFTAKEHLALCYGFVTVVPAKLLYCPLMRSTTLQNQSLFSVILESVSQLYNRHPNDCIILTSCLKVLCPMTQRLSFSQIHIATELLDFVISFLWSHLNHFQDVVKFLTRSCTSALVAQKDDYSIDKLLGFIESSKELDRRTCVLISCLNNALGAARVLSHRSSLPFELLEAARRDTSPSYIFQTFILLLVSSYHETDLDIWTSEWIEPLLSLDDVSTVYVNNALSEALKLSPRVAEKLLEFCRSVEKRNYNNAVNCVLALNRLNLVPSNSETEKPTQHLWRNQIPLSLMVDALRIPGSEKAVSTINLILESCRRSSPFTNEETELFRVYLDSNICNLNNYQRSMFLPLVDRIISRLAENRSRHEKNKITELFAWLSVRCFENLYPGASFSRRCISLKILEIMDKANVWHLETCDPECKLLIFSHLNDSFDENKITAKRLVESTSFPAGFLDEEQLQALGANIAGMISSARFCEHNTAVYVLELFLDQLCWGKVYQNCFARLNGVAIEHFNADEANVCREDNRFYFPLCALAEVLDSKLRSEDPEKCLSSQPVYGFLVLAKCLLEHTHKRYFSDSVRLSSSRRARWRELFFKFSKLCMELNLLSTTVVSQSSPEGYLPQNEFDLMLEDCSTCFSLSQRLLLVSWRTVKEASLMLAFFVEKFAFASGTEVDEALVPDKLVLQIGSHLESLIRGIKHRGAFEQVYIALCQFCRCCWRCSTNKTISVLPQKWLEDLAVSIESEGGSEELCLLRRSAGVPCIAQAILSTEYGGNMRKCGSSHLLDTFVNRLLDICGRETDINASGVKESKIHAANILRALFRNKDLDEQMSAYVERGLVLALQGVQSPFWGERNVSWLLFSSLMTKVFGVARCKREISAKNKMTVKMFFRKYPSLYTFFQKRLIDIGQSETSHAFARSSLYPILLIFQRLEVHSGSSREQCDTFELNSFIPLLFECSRSPVWKIRKLVVSAIFPFITLDIYEKYMSTLWDHIRSDLPENFLHGLLLQLETFLGNVPALGPEMRTRMQPLLFQMLEGMVDLLDDRKSEHSGAVERQFLTMVTWLLKLTPANASLHIRLERVLASRLQQSLDQESSASFQLSKGMQSEDLIGMCICAAASHRAEDAIIFLEDFIRARHALKLGRAILETIFCFISEDEFSPLNALLRNMPEMTIDGRERARDSEIFYSYVLEQSPHECSDCDSYLLETKILRAFVYSPKWLKDARTKIWLDRLLKTRDVFDEDSLVALVECASVVVEHSKNLMLDIRSNTLAMLVDYLQDTFSEEVGGVLIEFYFRYWHSLLWKNQELAVLRLKVWTLMLEYSLLPSSHLLQVRVKDSPQSKNESCSLETIMQAFCVETECELSFAAVACTSWILRYFGILCKDENANAIFVQNMPQCLEDDVIISRLAANYLNLMIKRQPNVVCTPLSLELSQWIEQQCAFEGNRFSSLNQVLEFTSREYIRQTTSKATSNLLLRADFWRSTILSNKMRCLSNIDAIKTILH